MPMTEKRMVAPARTRRLNQTDWRTSAFIDVPPFPAKARVRTQRPQSASSRDVTPGIRGVYVRSARCHRRRREPQILGQLYARGSSKSSPSPCAASSSGADPENPPAAGGFYFNGTEEVPMLARRGLARHPRRILLLAAAALLLPALSRAAEPGSSAVVSGGGGM